MSAGLRSSIERLKGVEIRPEFEQFKEVREGIGEMSVFEFVYEDVIFEATQVSAKNLTVNNIEISYRFPTNKKQDRSRILGAINSFNKSKLAMKAVLDGVEKAHFLVTFGTEFMCADNLIVDGMVQPTIKVLRSSGKLFGSLLGGHGVTLKDEREHD